MPNLCYCTKVFTMMPTFGQTSVYSPLKNGVYIAEVGEM
jgi:hypothetical protein